MEPDRYKKHEMRNCLFCRWAKVLYGGENEDEKLKEELEKRKIDEDSDWFAVLDKFPKVIGHTLIISKYPFNDFTDEIKFEDIDTEEHKANLFKACIRVAKKLMKLFSDVGSGKIYLLTMCDHFEIWETRSGFTTEHLHFHLIPRHPGMSLKAEKLIAREGKEWNVGDLARIAKLIKNSERAD